MNEEKELVSKEELNEEISNFKKFAFKKNMIELSVAVILGNSFNSVVGSISQNILMPIVNIILSQTDTEWREAKWTVLEGVDIEYGIFIGTFIDFLITAIVMYIIYYKIIKKMWE